ncbi:MAG: polysaccharide biosynthesis tyrosine autokinase [Chloroflexota bacterium]
MLDLQLKDYIAILKRWWWLLIISMTITIGFSFYLNSRQIPVYAATTTLVVGQSVTSAEFNASELWASTRIAQTYTQIGLQQPVMQGVVDSLGLSTDWQSLRNQVAFTAVRDTQLIQVQVTAGSLEEAKAIANEVANQLILLSPTSLQNQENSENYQFVRNQLERLIPRIEGGQARVQELEELMTGTISADQVEGIQGEINTLEQLISGWEDKYFELLRFSEGQRSPNYLAVTEPAHGSPAPLQSRARTNTIVFAFLGLFLATGVILLLEYLDDTIKSGDELKAFGVTPLGSIARLKGKQTDQKLIDVLGAFDPAVEAYRIIRSNIRFKTVDQPAKLMALTSSLPGEGKSTTVANLGIVMAQMGLKVIVVDADMRRPMQQFMFQVSSLGGLTELLVSPNLSAADQLVNTSIENLQVLPCGNMPPNPSELLETARMQELLTELSDLADIVLLDAPPVLAVTDAAILASRVDGVLLVIEAGKTRRDAIQRAIETLQEARVNIFGGILNQVNKNKSGYYNNYQGYYAANEMKTTVEQSKLTLSSPDQ